MNKTKCSITYNRSHINSADVVVFQPNDDYPETRLAKQVRQCNNKTNNLITTY